jgi:integrase/recombinase XerC/integrase/recombinase XerD
VRGKYGGGSPLEELKPRVGRLISLRNAQGFAERVRRYSGVERFHAHQLRHTFATRWAEKVGNVADLQFVVGHSSIVVTQRYARLTDEHAQPEAARIRLNS